MAKRLGQGRCCLNICPNNSIARWKYHLLYWHIFKGTFGFLEADVHWPHLRSGAHFDTKAPAGTCSVELFSPVRAAHRVLGQTRKQLFFHSIMSTVEALWGAKKRATCQSGDAKGPPFSLCQSVREVLGQLTVMCESCHVQHCKWLTVRLYQCNTIKLALSSLGQSIAAACLKRQNHTRWIICKIVICYQLCCTLVALQLFPHIACFRTTEGRIAMSTLKEYHVIYFQHIFVPFYKVQLKTWHSLKECTSSITFPAKVLDQAPCML